MSLCINIHRVSCCDGKNTQIGEETLRQNHIGLVGEEDISEFRNEFAKNLWFSITLMLQECSFVLFFFADIRRQRDGKMKERKAKTYLKPNIFLWQVPC